MGNFGKELDIEGIKLVFRRSSALPQLPGSALQLLDAIDGGDASARDIERIISCDAALTANLLRLANSAAHGMPGSITTIRAAILRLGQRSVRSLCLSLSVQRLLSGDTGETSFNPRRYAKHAVTVGFLGRYIFARRKQKEDFESRWSTDEFFAAGLLHDIGHAILSKVAPGVYSLVCNEAEQKRVPVNVAFRNLYGQGLGALGAEAARTWGLPGVFVPAIEYSENPTESESEQTELNCLNYADHLAVKYGATIEPWPCEVELDTMVESDVALADEEVEGVVSLVEMQTDSYLSDTALAA